MTPADRTELEELYEKLAVAEEALVSLDSYLSLLFHRAVRTEFWAENRFLKEDISAAIGLGDKALSLIRSKQGGGS